MKKTALFILLFIFFAASNTYSQIRSNKDLVGKWQSNEYKLEFFADGRVGLLMKGGNMPGATFKTDFLRNPALLDITVTQDRKRITFKAYISFVNNTTIELERYDQEDMGSGFTKGRIITLQKAR